MAIMGPLYQKWELGGDIPNNDIIHRLRYWVLKCDGGYCPGKGQTMLLAVKLYCTGSWRLIWENLTWKQEEVKTDSGLGQEVLALHSLLVSILAAL